jgi:hypothetical protein
MADTTRIFLLANMTLIFYLVGAIWAHEVEAAAVIGRAFEGSRREYPHHEVGMLRTEQVSR